MVWENVPHIRKPIFRVILPIRPHSFSLCPAGMHVQNRGDETVFFSIRPVSLCDLPHMGSTPSLSRSKRGDREKVRRHWQDNLKHGKTDSMRCFLVRSYLKQRLPVYSRLFPETIRQNTCSAIRMHPGIDTGNVRRKLPPTLYKGMQLFMRTNIDYWPIYHVRGRFKSDPTDL